MSANAMIKLRAYQLKRADADVPAIRSRHAPGTRIQSEEKAECGNKNHSAAFPKSLPTWFIKLFSEENDVVLDPFAGSATTCIAAHEINRRFIGIELKREYFETAEKNIENAQKSPVQQTLL